MKKLGFIIVTIAACVSSYAAKDFDLMDRLERRADVTVDEEFNFGGYEGHELTIGGVACKVVEPRETAHGAGLAKRVALEGMSRGGLIVYNWAAANPSKVACIYADAPVMDIKSWPMGEGEYTGSEVDIEQMLKAYGFASRAEALAWHGNPIDHAATIAKARIPLLHVVGDADVVVPVAENSAILEERLEALNYTKFQMIHKPGVGHHPHSLKDPTQIVNFILNATK